MKRLYTIPFFSVVLAMLSILNVNAETGFDYSSETHTLVINGTGDMPDYLTSENTPWSVYKDKITTVVVKQGVTKIGDNAFAKFSNLTYISLPEGLKEIGDFAFGETAAEQLVIPATVEKIGNSAFIWCDKLRTIYLGGNIIQLGSTGSQDQDYGAFAFCEAVADIYFYQINIESIAWNNNWEFKDNNATKIHVYESATLPEGLNCTFVKDIGNDLRSIGVGDMNNPDNPYEISEKWQLDFITALINSNAISSGSTYFKLIKDLEYDGTENNFTPLGTEDHSFAGCFDGDGHTISGINIKSKKDYAALFPYIDEGTLKNIKFNNIHIQTTGYHVGIIGGATDAVMENIIIENSSFQAGIYAGALVGLTEESNTVKNCHVKSNVSVMATSLDNVSSCAGGLIGRANGAGTVSGCSSGATVQAQGNNAAGLIGYNKATLTDCLYYGESLSANTNQPVVDAISINWEDGSVNNCLYTINHSSEYGAKAYVLTLGDGVELTNTVVNNYGTSDFPGITSYSDILLYDGKYYTKESTTLTFADQNAWYKVNEECLRTNILQMPDETTHVKLFALEGNGTETEPYIIHNVEEMDYFSMTVNNGNSYEGKYVELAADIAYDGNENNYTPVGKRTNQWIWFDGFFDGKGYSISGIKVIKAGDTYDNANGYNGIFGVTGPHAVIKNLVSDNNTFAGHYSGGIAGFNCGIIENCRSTSTVTLRAEWDYYSNSYHTWNGTNWMGGIVGYQPYNNNDPHGPEIIRGCVSAAYIDNNDKRSCDYFGGIVGANNASTPNIQHCLYLGNHVKVGKDLDGQGEGAVAGWTYKTTGYTPNSYYIDNSLTEDVFPLACKIIFSEGLEIDGEKTVYGEGDYEGITAYDNGMIYYDGVYYAPKGCEILTKVNSEDLMPLGLIIYPVSPAGTGDATSDGMSLTMGTADIFVALSSRSPIAKDNWIYYRSESFENISVTDKLLVITDEFELARFAYEVNVLGNTFEGWTVRLAEDKDFDMIAHRWEPVGSMAGGLERMFAGTFDGNRRLIRELKASITDAYTDPSVGSPSNTQCIGLFSVLPENATVKDLFMSEATITEHRNVGVVVGENMGTVTNCHVFSSTVTAVSDNAQKLGGVAGWNHGGTLTYCSASETDVTDGAGYGRVSCFGGICGTNSTIAVEMYDMTSGSTSLNLKTAILENNIFFGKIQASGNDPLGYFGAVAGSNQSGFDSEDNEYPTQMSSNYYDGTTLVVDNEVPPTYSEDVTHPFDTSKGFGVGQTSPNGNLSYESADVEGKAEPLAMDARDNTEALILLAKRNKYFDRDNNSLLYFAKHPFTLKGRTLYRNARWNTLCLPFAVTDFSNTPLAGATVMTLASSSFNNADGTLKLNFSNATTIEAGKPYIVKWASGSDIANPTFMDVTISNATNPVETDYLDFVGTFSPIDIFTEEKTNLYLGADNKLCYPWGDGMKAFMVNSFRAFFQLNNGLLGGDPVNHVKGINNFVVNFGGEATGIGEISNIKSQTSATESWYSLDGRKISNKPTQKGIYIHNGLKVVIQ